MVSLVSQICLGNASQYADAQGHERFHAPFAIGKTKTLVPPKKDLALSSEPVKFGTS